MITLVSKGNGRNYYGYDEKGNIHEVVKIRGSYYKYVMKSTGLTPVGDALTKEQFTLVED